MPPSVNAGASPILKDSMRLRVSLTCHAVRWLEAVALCTAALCAPAASVSAQGFGLNEIGTCAVSRGFAVTGATCNDASVIYWNPAAAAELDRNTVSVGANAIIIRGGFTQDTTGTRYGSNIQPQLVPSLFANVRRGRLAVGLGVYVPYGLTSQWNDNFPGRFSALKARLQTIYVQPNIAYQLNGNWSIGGGPVFGSSDVELTQSLDLSQQVAAQINGAAVRFGQLGIAQNTEFGRIRLAGSAHGIGYNVGVHGKYADWSVGARYLSALNFHYTGATATFTQRTTGLFLAQNNPIVPGGSPAPLDLVLASQFSSAGALSSQTGDTRITHPWQAQAGIGYSGLPGTVLSADVVRLGWSKFSTLPLVLNGNAAASSRTLLEDYHDSWSYRFGAEHTICDAGWLYGWTGRVGYSYAETPAPDVTVTPLLPDMNRRNFSAGLGIPVGPRYRLDAGYLHVNTPGRRGRIIERSSASQTAQNLNSGVYDLKADVISLSLNATF